MKKILPALLALLSIATLSFANGSKESQAGQISWQVWITPNLTREYYDSVAKGFEAQNPGVKVTIVETNSNAVASASDFIKTRLAAGDVPDLWSNIEVKPFADAGQLWQLPQDDPDLTRVKNLMVSAYKGKLYSMSTVVQPQGLMFYNKKLWAQAGLTGTPKTWEELDAACAALKAAGITPIIAGGDWVAGYVFCNFVSPQVFHNDTKWYADRWEGKVHFTDPDFVEAASWFNGLIAKGYFNKGALSIAYSDLQDQFLAGKAAIYSMGSWFTAAEATAQKDFEVGVFFSPTKDGKQHMLQEITYGRNGIYSKSKNPQAAWKLWKYSVMDPASATKGLEADGLYSALVPPLTYSMTKLQKDLESLIPTAKTVSGHYNNNVGEAPPSGIDEIYNRVGQSFLAGGVTDVKPLLQQLDDFWARGQ